jgi:hypothetical protein
MGTPRAAPRSLPRSRAGMRAPLLGLLLLLGTALVAAKGEAGKGTQLPRAMGQPL